jgi:hypothetical protein
MIISQKQTLEYLLMNNVVEFRTIYCIMVCGHCSLKYWFGIYFWSAPQTWMLNYHRKICSKTEVLCKVVYCIPSTLKLSLMRKKISLMNLGLLCSKILQSLVSISTYLIIWHRTNQNEIKSFCCKGLYVNIDKLDSARFHLFVTFT